MERDAGGRPLPAGPVGVLRRLPRSSSADADRDRRVRHSQCSGGDDSGRRSGTRSRIGRGLEAGGHVTWLDATYNHYTAVNFNNVAGRRLGQPVEQCARMVGPCLGQWNGDVGASRRLSIAADATAQSTVYYTPFNDNIQFQGPYSLLGARVEYRPSNRRWAIAAYARNLTNTDYLNATFGTSQVVLGGRPGPQRQVAIDFKIQKPKTPAPRKFQNPTATRNMTPQRLWRTASRGIFPPECRRSGL